MHEDALHVSVEAVCSSRLASMRGFSMIICVESCEVREVSSLRPESQICTVVLVCAMVDGML